MSNLARVVEAVASAVEVAEDVAKGEATSEVATVDEAAVDEVTDIEAEVMAATVEDAVDATAALSMFLTPTPFPALVVHSTGSQTEPIQSLIRS